MFTRFEYGSLELPEVLNAVEDENSIEDGACPYLMMRELLSE